MSLTSCSRHPDEPAKGLCARCGDFLCVKCKAESPAGLCAECTKRGVPPPKPSTTTSLALIVAVLCALLSGGFLLSTSGLYVYLARGATVNGVAYWNGFIGLVYFAIAYQLVRRSPGAYSWAVQTQALNSALGGYNLFSILTKPNPHSVVVALSGISLAFHVTGWIATWLSRSHFEKR